MSRCNKADRLIRTQSAYNMGLICGSERAHTTVHETLDLRGFLRIIANDTPRIFTRSHG